MLESKQVKQNNSLESDVGGESDTKEKNYQDLTFFFSSNILKGIGGLHVQTKPQRPIFTLNHNFHCQIMLWHPQTAATVYRSRTGLTKVIPSGTLGSFILKVVSNEVNATCSTANSSSLSLLIRFIAEINFKEGFEKTFCTDLLPCTWDGLRQRMKVLGRKQRSLCSEH